MFDFRYHALSLAAVFIALTVGLVLGVAIGDQGLVSNAEKDLKASLRRNVVRARQDAADARDALATRRRIEEDDFFPVMVSGRLSAERIGVVALGDVPDSLVQNVKSALTGTGAKLASVSVVGEPLDLPDIADAAGKTRYAKIVQKPALAGRLGRKVGGQLSVGGAFLGRIQGAVFQRSSSSGALSGLEGVVLVHRPPTSLQGRDERVAKLFEDGLVKGLRANGVRVVGAEDRRTSLPPSRGSPTAGSRAWTTSTSSRAGSRSCSPWRGAGDLRHEADGRFAAAVGRHARRPLTHSRSVRDGRAATARAVRPQG